MTRPVHAWLPIPLVVLILALPLAAAIYGGTDAAEGEHPYMAHLFIGAPRDGIVCGATLIAPTYLLTAAHCVPNPVDAALGPNPLTGGEDLREYRALFGRADLEAEGGEVLGIAQAFVHPGYEPLLILPTGALMPQNDIAVLQLERAVAYAPIRLATSADVALYPAGATARVIGWGWTDEGEFPARLKQVDVPVWSDEACQAAPNYAVMLHPESEVCAGADGLDSCGGDSGGPLFVRDAEGRPVEIGIVNYGALFEVNADDPWAGFAPCGSGQHPGVYAEVAAYEAFLAPFIDGPAMPRG